MVTKKKVERRHKAADAEIPPVEESPVEESPVEEAPVELEPPAPVEVPPPARVKVGPVDKQFKVARVSALPWAKGITDRHEEIALLALIGHLGRMERVALENELVAKCQLTPEESKVTVDALVDQWMYQETRPYPFTANVEGEFIALYKLVG